VVVLTRGLDENDRVAAALVVVEARYPEVVEGGGEAHGRNSPWSVSRDRRIDTLRGYLEPSTTIRGFMALITTGPTRIYAYDPLGSTSNSHCSW
jgi:hypothetical protein